MSINITPARRARLEKLATYLEYLPEDYTHFNMGAYYDPDYESKPDLDTNQLEYLYARKEPKNLFKCGTVACALGHAPAAGIAIPPRFVNKESGVDWDGFGSEMFLGEEDTSSLSEEYNFIFGGYWTVTDDHHWGAAARIRYLLAGHDIDGQETKEDYAAYRVTEAGPMPAGAYPFSASCCKVPA